MWWCWFSSVRESGPYWSLPKNHKLGLTMLPFYIQIWPITMVMWTERWKLRTAWLTAEHLPDGKRIWRINWRINWNKTSYLHHGIESVLSKFQAFGIFENENLTKDCFRCQISYFHIIMISRDHGWKKILYNIDIHL